MLWVIRLVIVAAQLKLLLSVVSQTPIITLLLSQCLVSANYNDIYVADIQYDWINKNEPELREKIAVAESK